MQIDRVHSRLQEHHRDIEACLYEGYALLGGGDACQLKALALVRWRLMRALRAYQLFKHTEVFDPIIALGTLPSARRAELLKRRCIEVGEAYHDHVKQWTLSGPAQAWPHYVLDAEAMIRRIRAHLTDEAKGVEELVSGMQRTRERGAA